MKPRAATDMLSAKAHAQRRSQGASHALHIAMNRRGSVRDAWRGSLAQRRLLAVLRGGDVWLRVADAFACFVVAVICLGGCTPNVVVGSREQDAAVLDGANAQEAAEPDAGAALGTDEPLADAAVRDAGPSPSDAGAGDEDADVQTVDDDACTSPEQCRSSDEPVCDLNRGRCVECLSDAQCDPSERCESDGECGARPIPCTSRLQCTGTEDPFCHATDRICVECESDAHCPSDERCQADGECD